MKQLPLTRSAGVFLNISSLNGLFGIGKLGAEARAFANSLHDMGFKWWQILPLNPVGSGNSPYSSYSSFAGNVLYIDPASLYRDGLITITDVNEAVYEGSPYAADYDFARHSSDVFLHRAFENRDADITAALDVFSKENSGWLRDYALYMTLKEHYDGAAWYEWPDKSLRRHDSKALRTAEQAFADEIKYHEFTQYLFYRQWEELREYVNGMGIGFIGDIPIYVLHDSADVWAHPEQFLLEANSLPSFVAGCPPDAFSADGQLWGNPIYNWREMKKDGYAWWCARIGAALKLYDRVRIDHFRGFAAYWSIPAGAKTATEGKWEPGPGIEPFMAFKKAAHISSFANMPIIAEDLGQIDDDVKKLIADTGFPGMRVMHFGFDSDPDNPHIPHNHEKNTIAYTGTHDNNTTLAWLYDASPVERDYILRYCSYFYDNWNIGGPKSASVRAVIRTLWQSPSILAIIPMQDLCGFGGDTRLNKPGVAFGNWEYRFSGETIHMPDAEFFRDLNHIFGRDFNLEDKSVSRALK